MRAASAGLRFELELGYFHVVDEHEIGAGQLHVSNERRRFECLHEERQRLMSTVCPNDAELRGAQRLGEKAARVFLSTDRIRHDARIHDFAFDDCVRLKLRDRDFHQPGCSLAVIDYRDLDQSRSNISNPTVVFLRPKSAMLSWGRRLQLIAR